MSDDVKRRSLLKAIASGLGAGGSLAIMPESWTRPILHSVIVPAHATASPGVTTTTTTAAPGPSDVRLKRDIVQVGRLNNGLGLYRYRYIWGDEIFVGVMAQEVAKIIPEAVERGADGYLRVHYARLGMHMMTWEEWVAADGRPSQDEIRSGMSEEQRSAI